MSDLLPNVPAWQLAVVFGLFFATMAYLYIDWRRQGEYGYLKKHLLELEIFGVPDKVASDGDPAEYESIVRGRISGIERPWYTLTLDVPWEMWRGTLTSVRLKSVHWFRPINDVSGRRALPVIVDIGNDEKLRADLRIKYV